MVNPVPRTYVRGFGALPFGEAQNIHPRTNVRGVLWDGIKEVPMVSEKILVVEDNRDSLELLKIQLKFLGWDVVPARNGREALEIVRMNRPNLVVLDMLMPEIDGFLVARVLKSDPDWRRIPILAATALAMPGDRERCLAAGCDDYLSKPFTHRELKEHLKRLLAATGSPAQPSAEAGPARGGQAI